MPSPDKLKAIHFSLEGVPGLLLSQTGNGGGEMGTGREQDVNK